MVVFIVRPVYHIYGFTAQGSLREQARAEGRSVESLASSMVEAANRLNSIALLGNRRDREGAGREVQPFLGSARFLTTAVACKGSVPTDRRC